MKTGLHYVIGAVLLFMLPPAIHAQYTPMTTGTQTTCSGFLTDPAGPDAPYGPNQLVVTTLCPAPGPDSHVSLSFLNLDLGDGDELCFYDGADSTATLLRCISGPDAPTEFLVQATAANPGGCLTIVFRSDDQDQGAGWAADISCTTACQDIIAVLDSTRPAASPNLISSVDVCPGERVFFFGSGQFPQNNIAYEHTNANSEFRWDFGDGTFAYGRTVSKRYDVSGAYTVRLTITDPFGCTNINALTQLVRVAPRPNFSFAGNAGQAVCAGETINLDADLAGANPGSDLTIGEGTAFYAPDHRIIERVALPDGIGVGYESTITVRDFAPGQTIQSANDLANICINLEHSWGRDLQISLICPDGQTIILQPGAGERGDQFYLGDPVENDETRLRPGTGFTYCWSEAAGNPDWNTYLTQNGVDTLPAGTYRPANSLANLIGCPVNGTWTLRIVDQFPDDNGYLFGWNLEFADILFPDMETFSPTLASGTWRTNAYVDNLSATNIQATPTFAGTAYFDYTTTDAFGCSFDTTLQVPVRPFSDPACLHCEEQYPDFEDISACEDETIQLDASGTIPLDTAIEYQNNPQYALGFANHPPENPYRNTIAVSGVLQDTLTDPFEQIESVCLNLETDWDEDIRLFLQAPNGAVLELSTNNGGQGDNYTSTCFTPDAPISITEGTAPFRGDFLPEGSWDTLRGSPINGDWTLIISDEFDDAEFGRIVDWSISFHSVKEVTYEWSGDPGLSCTDCPDPEVTTGVNATYTVTITDTYGCSRTNTVHVEIVPVLEGPDVVCQQSGPDAFTFTWNRPPGVSSFDLTLSVNGITRPTALPFQDTFLVVNGLAAGDSVALEVLPIIFNTGDYCRIETGFSSCIFGECLLNASLIRVRQPTCFGANNGEAEVGINIGTPPYRYFLNNSSQPQGDPVFRNLDPGPYFIVVQDATFCTDTLEFDIVEPDSLAANVFEARSISCFGNSDGRLETLAEGGTEPYRFSWDTGDDNTFIDGLSAGTYRVTISDANGCQEVDVFDLREPDSLWIQFTATDVSCFGDTTGSIAPLVRGGTPGFTFAWDNGSTDSLQMNLGAGSFSTTVTDANGCVVSGSQALTQPPELRVDSFRVRDVDCFGRETGQASIFVSGGNGPYEYLWDDELAQIGITASNLPAGQTNLTVVDFNRCELDTSVFIVQPDTLTIAIDASDAQCKDGNEGQAVATVMGGTGPFNYLWQDGQTTPTADSLARGNYRITVTDDNGCRALATASIDEPELALNIEARQTEQGCFGQQQNQAIALAQGGSGGDYRYRWSNGQNTPGADNLDSLTYMVSVTDGNGCVKSVALNLEDLPDMVPNMIVNAPSCFGFDNGAIGINFVEGRPNSELSNFRFVWNTGQIGSNINNIVGDSTYTVTVTDTRGCSATASRFVREPTQITFDIETTPTTCPGGNNGTALVTNVTSDNQDLVYQWDAGTGNQEGISASNLSAGVYQVTVTDAFNCFATVAGRVEEPEPIEATFEVTDNACFGDQQGQATATVVGGTPGYDLNWADGRTGTTISQLAAGTYRLNITDAEGCTANSQVTVSHPPPIDVTLRTEDVTCFGERDGGIIAEVEGGAPPYTYSLDNQEYQGSPLLIGLTAGTYDVYVRDEGGCTLFERTMVTQPEQFVIDAGPSITRIDRGDSLQLQADIFGAQGQVLYEWYAPFGDNLSCLSCPDPVAFPDNTISYEVIGIDSVGCEASDRIQVIVDKVRFVVVPTGFSPNGDGENDQLLVHGKDGTLIERFQVYDRWGELVFQREDFDVNDPAGWDGLFRGQDAPTGVYIWYMEVQYPDESEEVLRGQTALIR